ncbi:CdaR family transcriptional regulator [Streptomyces sp. NL15-2K]|uniref:PucR family transcriptional regulator n=1 Tax=Streptomyces sp. NL15-2K TaxID=376149 RepID=UPI000F5881D0|nr:MULTISPECIES: helix-turn-helix domain-containing protein [Actinomycetes]WKX08629.1 helix-turn-helix domain-containing protein [Kutzneria buriramensis]GCB49890.1 transcriptional regulator associated with nicotine utilization [Streptomyces sp. NL15-2K]
MTPDSVHRFIRSLVGEESDLPTEGAAAEAEGALPESAAVWAARLSRHLLEKTISTMSPDEASTMAAVLPGAVEQRLMVMLRRLDGDTAPLGLAPEQVALMHRLVHVGQPYTHFLLGLQTTRRELTDQVIEHLNKYQPEHERPALMRFLIPSIGAFFDETLDAMLSEYLAERERLMAQELSNRQRMISALVAGQPVASEHALDVLGVDLDHHHLALVLSPVDSSGPALDVHSDMGRTAAAVADSLGAGPPLTFLPDSAPMWCWISRPTPFPDDCTDALSSVCAQRPVHIAAGVPASGAAGFRRSHLAALDAHRVAETAGDRALTTYHDVGLAALLSADPERARWFVGEELRDLAAEDPKTADLRATALEYLRTGQNLLSTAAALHVHRNTVVYRLRNIERLLGRRLEERPLEIHAALALMERIGTL